MIRKILVYIFFASIYIYADLAHAGIGSLVNSVGACVTDPCGCNCPTVNEVWQTDTGKNTGNPSLVYTKSYSSPNCNCPPYNKFNMSLLPTGGSKNSRRSGCLKGKSIPGKFETADYSCAEAVKDNYYYDYNSYFEPRIKVRTQGCFGGCWFEDKSLKFNGECQYFATSNLVIPVRICARVAFKGYDGEPDDYGYMYVNGDTTKPGHLTSKGYVEIDPDYVINEITEAADGAQTTQNVTYKIYPPKICAYEDPDLFITWMKAGGPFSNIGQVVQVVQSAASGGSLVSNIDYLDWNPTNQPLHKTTYGSPIISLIIFVVQQGLNLAEMLGGAIGKLFDKMNADFLVDAIQYITKAVDFIGTGVIVPILEELNSLNRIVDNTLGCVNVPLGPPPPPYCSSLSQNYRPLEMHKICRTNHDGSVESPTLENQCQKSQTPNKYLRPSIRGTFDLLVSQCANGVAVSNGCIAFSNPGSPQIIHDMYGGIDFIPKCSSSITSGCVNSTLPTSVSWTYNGVSYSGYRVVYGFKSSSSVSTPLTSYIYTNADGTGNYTQCSSVVSSNCIFLYGINAGQFYDLNMSFPSTEPTYNNSDLTSTYNFTNVSTSGTNTQNTTAIAKVLRVQTDTSTQGSNELCLYDNTDGRLVDCQERLTPPKPVVYSCGSPSANISCTSTHFIPKMVVSVESAGNSSQGVVTPTLMASDASTIDAIQINLGGHDYDSFVTDNSFRTIPYDLSLDSHAYSENSRYGNYVGGVNPINTSNPVYINGLEYDFSRYVVGGEKICLTGYVYDRCSIEYNKHCVLTNRVGGVASFTLADRITPASSVGAILSDNQYFNYGVDSFTQSTQSVRDKTSIEMNLCVNVPSPPSCAEVSSGSADSNSGFATWPDALPSEVVTGTCLPNYISGGANGPQRACFLDKTTHTSTYQGVVPGTECMSGLKLDSKQKWQKIPISMMQGDVYDINITGEVSLCQGYVPSNNLQQSSANDSSGNPVAIPRLNETTNNGVGLKLNPRDSAWKSIADLYPGDKLSVMVGPKNICEFWQFCSPNQTFYNVMTKSNESANCSSGLQDYHPLCGTVGVWDNKPYDLDWLSGGASLLHQITNLSPQLGTMSPRDLNWSDRPVYASADGMAGYKILYQNFSNSVSGTYQMKYNDSNYNDNHGGYIIYVKQTKCVRTNAQAATDPGMTNRGQIKAYFATNGENPNDTSQAGTSLSINSSGYVRYTAPANGYLWLKIDNNSSDYAKSQGMYDVTMEKLTVCGAITNADSSTGFATWPQAGVGQVVRGSCLYPPAVLPYRSCNTSGSSAVFGSIVNNLACTDPATFIFPYAIYASTADTDYVDATSGVIWDYTNGYLNAILTRSQASSNNSYSYNIYFSVGDISQVTAFSTNQIIYSGDIIVKLNGTTIFNSASPPSGWTNTLVSGVRTYFSNGNSNSNLMSNIGNGSNIITVQNTNNSIVNNSQRGYVKIIFNYTMTPFDFGGGWDWGGGMGGIK